LLARFGFSERRSSPRTGDYDTSIDSASLAGHIHFAEGQTKSKHRTIDKVLKALLVAGTACADSPAVAESSAESLRRIRHPKVLPDRRRIRALSGHFVATDHPLFELGRVVRAVCDLTTPFETC